MRDRVQEIVLRQMQAMESKVFEVGLFKPGAKAEMLLRTWDSDALIESIPWLKFQNVDGRNIYIRPKGEHSLSLVDDLTAASLDRMKHSGFTPAVIVETSPDNFQAWLNHGRDLPKDTSTAAARALAEKFGGDPGSADWRHFGRLASFSNRKPKYEFAGRYPFVRLLHSTGEVYERAADFVSEIERRVEAQRVEAEHRRDRYMKNVTRGKATPAKGIEAFRNDPRYAGDGNRIDLAYAVYALSHRVPEDEVRRTIASRDLTKKGTAEKQADYIERTLEKALRTVGVEECRGR